MVLEKTLESPLDRKEIQPVHRKGDVYFQMYNIQNNPDCSLEELMLKLKLQYFAHLMQRTDSSEDPAAGKDWRREEKGMTENEMVGWHHWLDGHGFG